MSSRCFVYKMLRDNNDVVYVGCTQDPNGRLRTHESQSYWFDESVKKIEVEVYDNRVSALAREADIIGELSPIFNMTSVDTSKYRRRKEVEKAYEKVSLGFFRKPSEDDHEGIFAWEIAIWARSTNKIQLWKMCEILDIERDKVSGLMEGNLNSCSLQELILLWELANK